MSSGFTKTILVLKISEIKDFVKIAKALTLFTELSRKEKSSIVL